MRRFPDRLQAREVNDRVKGLLAQEPIEGRGITHITRHECRAPPGDLADTRYHRCPAVRQVVL